MECLIYAENPFSLFHSPPLSSPLIPFSFYSFYHPQCLSPFLHRIHPLPLLRRRRFPPPSLLHVFWSVGSFPEITDFISLATLWSGQSFQDGWSWAFHRGDNFPESVLMTPMSGELKIFSADPESNRFLIQNKEKLLDFVLHCLYLGLRGL